MNRTRYALLSILLLTGLLVVLNYHRDIPLDTLKERYTYPESRFISLEGMEVHYRLKGQGPDLLLIHGTGASLHTWEAWTEILQNDFRVISVDLPAFGLTGPHPRRDYSMSGYIEFLETFRQAIGMDRFHLAGNSLGGMIAWQYALAHPARVERLVLIDASGMPRTQPLPLAIRMAKNPLLAKMLRKITPKALFIRSLREVYYDDDKITDSVAKRYFELFLRPGNRQAFADRARQPYSADTSRLQQIESPTLILWGENDTWVPLEHAYQFQRIIPMSELIVYPQCGHVPMEEIPEESARDVRAFLLK